MEEKRGLLYRCFLTKQSAFYNYLRSEKDYVPEIDNPDSIRIKSKITIPLTRGDRLIGIVTCYSSVKKIKNFSEADFKKLQAITPLVTEAIIRMQANRGREIAPLSAGANERPLSLERQGAKISRTIQAVETNGAKKNPTRDRECLLETASLVHDIRTPASNLLGFLEMLENQIDDPRLRKYLENAQKSAQLINEITDTLLDKAATTHRQKSERQCVNALRLFAEKRLRYRIHIDPALPGEIMLESMKLKRVLLNLLGNAIKFTPTGGSVQLKIGYIAAKKQLSFRIQDSGIGIPEEKQHGIFEAFTQAEETTKERFGGSGLGLSITAKLVREMGGTLQFQSELDKGSVFFFDLPVRICDPAPKLPALPVDNLFVTLVLDPSQKQVASDIGRYLVEMGVPAGRIHAVTSAKKIPEETTHLVLFQSRFEPFLLQEQLEKGRSVLVVEEKFLSMREPLPPECILLSPYRYYGKELHTFLGSQSPLRVLIVEDDPISTELIRSMLVDEECVIDTARDGLEGLEKLIEAAKSSRAYQLVFSDHNMPRLSGEEMLRRYRQTESGSPLFAVSTSGDPNEKDSEGLFDAFANKPFRRAEILSILGKARKQITSTKE